MKRLFFIRHGESEANAKDILASRNDFHLTDSGRRQARDIADKFCEENKLDLVVTSPLARAMETADPFVVKSSSPLIIRDEIIEQHLGRFSGMTYAELEAEPEYCHDRTARWDWIPEGGGESYRMIAARVNTYFEWLKTRPERMILTVTHAVTLRLIKAVLENTLPEYPREIAKNGEIWDVDYNGLKRSHFIKSCFYSEIQPEHRA